MSYYLSFDRESRGEPREVLIITVLLYKKFFFNIVIFKELRIQL